MERLMEVIDELSDRLNGKHTDTSGRTVLAGYSLGKCNELLDEILSISRKANEELQSYRTAEEQGLLLRLPCKVGSTVYYIDDYEIYSDKVDSINIRKENEEYIFCIAFMDYRAEDFGRNVFLTREEAEQALAEMQKG